MTALGLVLAAGVGWCAAVPSASAPQPDTMPLTRAQWQAKLGWPVAECPLEAPDEGSSGVRQHSLAGQVELVEIECQRFAYQGTRMVYRLAARGAVALSFEQFEAPDVGRLERYRSTLLTGLLSVKPGSARLEVLRKYRGAGDCGQFLRYRLRDDGAVLAELRVRECGRLPTGKSVDPTTWPRKRP